MAKKTIIELIDDISGETLADDAGRTITFGIDGAEYEIDLSNGRINELHEALRPYTQAARRVATRRPGSKARRTGSSDVQAIREWAAANGHQVATRGRIPATLREAYENR